MKQLILFITLISLSSIYGMDNPEVATENYLLELSEYGESTLRTEFLKDTPVGLYGSGRMSFQDLTQYKSSITTKLNAETSSGEKNDSAFGVLYKTYYSKVHSAATPPNANLGQSCSFAKCKSGLVCQIQQASDFGSSCQKHSDCSSGTCSSIGFDTPGKCSHLNKCGNVLVQGDSCTKGVSSCNSGIICKDYNRSTSLFSICIDKGKSCQSNSECCSNKCGSNSKCVKNTICSKKCTELGGMKTNSRACCEGLITNDQGRCVSDAPPL